MKNLSLPVLRWCTRPLIAVSFCLGFNLAIPAHAADRGDEVEASERKRVFPGFRKKVERPVSTQSAAPAPVIRAVVIRHDEDPELVPDLKAEELEEGSKVQEFIAASGEVPTQEQVEALEEAASVTREQSEVINEIRGKKQNLSLLTNPAEAVKTDPLFLDMIDPADFDIPVEVNPAVEKWLTYFTGPGRKHYKRWMERSSRFRPMMYRELEKADMPRDLVYLSMIESGYNAHAYSHAAAAGLWQFIPSTAKIYDLRVDWWVDDRRDPQDSVKAAITFLGELHRMFDGDWRLAWAAYNGGPGRIRRAKAKANSKDFWTLANGPYLHSETDNYVPKIMAAAIIGHYPERYGFKDIKYQSELVYDVVPVKGSVALEDIAKASATTVAEIKALNPALRRYATPPEGYDVRVPKGKKATFLAKLDSLPKAKKPAAKATVVRHTVKKGETLSIIAGKYGTSVAAISKKNGLKNANKVYVGSSLLVPKGAAATRAAVAKKAPSKPSSHTVAKGETLSGIASKYGVSASALRGYNGLGSSSKILVGQKLKLNGASSKSTAKTRYHTVGKGEILARIASKYGVKMSDLQKWNGIKNPSHIKVGQKLKVVGGGPVAPTWRYHTVVNGESLGRISNKYGVSVKTLQTWNKLKGSTIHPGQKLKVKKG